MRASVIAVAPQVLGARKRDSLDSRRRSALGLPWLVFRLFNGATLRVAAQLMAEFEYPVRGHRLSTLSPIINGSDRPRLGSRNRWGVVLNRLACREVTGCRVPCRDMAPLFGAKVP